MEILRKITLLILLYSSLILLINSYSPFFNSIEDGMVHFQGFRLVWKPRLLHFATDAVNNRASLDLSDIEEEALHTSQAATNDSVAVLGSK